MDKNPLLFAIYEISMSIGNSFELKKMLNESMTTILSRLNCSSVSIYKKCGTSYESIYSKPKVLINNKLYIKVIHQLETKFFKEKANFLVEQVEETYYYLFDLKNFGYLILTKSGKPLDEAVLNSLKNINLKLVNAIQACEVHTSLQEYKSRLYEVQSITHLGSWMTELPSKRHYWDDELFRLLGEEPQSFEPSYRKLMHRLTPESQKKIIKVTRDIFRGDREGYKVEVDIIKKDGSLLIAEVKSKLLVDKEGKPISLVGTVLDISKRYQLEQQLRDESTLLKSIINTVPVRIFWKDTNSRYLGGNRLFADDADLEDESQLVGKDDYAMPWRDQADIYRAMDKDVLDGGTSKINVEEPLTDKYGIEKWVSTSKVPLIDEHGNTFGILGTYLDITTRKENEKNLRLQRDALEHQAYHDVLTGLPNRSLFLDRLNQYIHKAHRNKTKIAVLFIDMDRFKEINDSLGHTFGDKAIQEVARRIENQIRDTDTLARFGGDEFILICNAIDDPIFTVTVVEKIMQSMSAPIIIDGHSIYVTLSIGISVYPDDAQIADDLLKNADAAMYKAKNDGRNTYSFYTEDMTEKAFARIKLEARLRKAIENENFMLYFQPQFNAKTNMIIGMETLVRWKDGMNGFVPPNNFIPIAEETGLIIPLGNWVMRKGMEQMVKWHADGLRPGKLAINFSMVQLQKRDFISILAKLLKETKCKSEWLEVEITESQVMKNPEETILTLQRISEIGIKISIDDFGTGYSSLSYLKRLPINTLKIDRSFIRDIPKDEEDVAITKAIIALAESLNLEVIAEGVESTAQKDFLVKNSCNHVQGYLYAKPMPADEMEELLNSGTNAIFKGKNESMYHI
jgi:diguanylate cyclase (GGDEF)-like protein/PAS domain S-box-containing protein